MITAVRNGKYVNRNDDTESEDDDEDDIPLQGNPQPNVFPRNPVSVIDGIPSGPNIQSIVIGTIYMNSESMEQFICTC